MGSQNTAARYDIFFGFSQIEIEGKIPSDRNMFDNLFKQVKRADELGFDTAWIGGSHFSIEQHHLTSPNPVLPHFRGEVCINTDIVALGLALFSHTKKIGIGSAIQSLFANGGPIGNAESLRTIHCLKQASGWGDRKLKFGFGTGRFDFAHRAYGIFPRSEREKAYWPIIKREVFRQAVEIFLRLLRGEAIGSDDVTPLYLYPDSFQTAADWDAFRGDQRTSGGALELESFWSFERIALIPKVEDLDDIELYCGSTDLATVRTANRYLPTRVFNLSNTTRETIEATHTFMAENYNPEGGPWRRDMMPRTVLVFVCADPGLTRAERVEKARSQALKAMSAWQKAMEGTIENHKLKSALDNSIFGDPEQVASQIQERFDPKDRLMLWFDFNNHATDEVERSMDVFAEKVIRRLAR